MISADLKAALQEIYDDNHIGVAVYALVKGAENTAPVKLDIEAEALKGVKELFLNSLRERISDREELSVINLSAADERSDAVYVYDLELPAELSALETIVAQDNLALLNLANVSLSQIKALLIEMGNNEHHVVLYKTLPPVNVFGREGFFLKRSNTRLEKIDDEFLRISSGFQMLRIKNELLILDLVALEKSFGFHDVIKREAVLGCRSISAAAILDNPEVYEELADDVKYARKLTKVAKASPVLAARIPAAEIVKFCKDFPSLAGRIRFNAAEDKVVLDTKVSKDLFIKVLMDDFLTSELTKFFYASLAKDKVEAEG